MNETTIEKIEKEIDEKIKLPKDIKENIIKEVFTNIIMAIGIMVYLTFLILGSVGAVKNIRIIDFNIFSIILLGISILLFEIAWKKDSGRLAMYGIEMLAIALFTLFLPYIIFELSSPTQKFYLIASAYTTVYYSIKSIYIALKSRKKHMITVNDIKDIVKREKVKRVINDDIEEPEKIEVIEEIDNKDSFNYNVEKLKNSKKQTSKKAEQKKSELKNKEDKKKETKNQKDTKKEVAENIIEAEKTNKRGRPKRQETDKVSKPNKEDIKNKIEENTISDNQPKKRGRPKKDEDIKNKKSIKQEEKAPKKRGRPRKVVTND